MTPYCDLYCEPKNNFKSHMQGVSDAMYWGLAKCTVVDVDHSISL